MKKIILLAAVALMSTASVHAEKRTKSQIIAAASEVLQDKGLKTSTANGDVKLEILDTSFSQLSVVGYKNGSYVIVANDDSMPAILGYSDKGVSFDNENMAPAFKWYLEIANRNIEECLSNGTQLPKTTIDPSYKPEVPMMCQTQWSQSEPYNRLTPTFINYSGNEEHYVTGCVATAMAQAMKYYNYPDVGRGRIKYSFKTSDGSTEKVSVSFDDEPFDWDNMLNQYNQYQYDSDEAYAVSYLMKVCGAASRMSYGESGSGAYTIEATEGLIKYFKYDPSTDQYYKDMLHIDEWYDIAYRSLNAGYPIIFGASSSIGGQDAGHSFVVDGYNTDGLVHVNFGWGGDSDGYYQLMNMHGYDHGFDMTPLIKPQPELKLTSLWGQWASSLSYNKHTGDVKANIINARSRSFSGRIGVILKNLADGSEQMIGYLDYSDETMIKDGQYYNILPYATSAPLPEGLADGEYRLFLASKGIWSVKKDPTDRHSEEVIYEEKDWQPVRCSESYKNSYLITISGGVATSATAEKESNWVLGIDDVMTTIHNSDIVKVYDIEGRMLYTSSSKDFRINDVPATGMLIIKEGNEVRKVMKK